MRHSLPPFALALLCLTAPLVGQEAQWVGDPELRLPGDQGVPHSAPPAVCRARRTALAAEVEQGVLIVQAGPSPDSDRFQPDDQFWWLTGLDAADASLWLTFKGGEIAEERLYLPAYSRSHERWNGPRLHPGEAAAELSGIADTRGSRALRKDLEAHFAGDDPAEVRGSGAELEDVFAGMERELGDLPRALRDLQAVKDAGEARAVRAAVEITEAALADAFVHARPGAWEYEVEAAVEAGFRRRGAPTFAFPSIIGSGANSCFLHYRANEDRIEDGELVLMDVGAKFQHYCADVTRTIPANGKFTERQREIYGIVLGAQEKAMAALKPGVTQRELDRIARTHIAEAGYGDAFLHGLGHGLGLVVHDRPATRTPLRPGMVITIEPGIYLADEGLGVRIEDDFLITEDGYEHLSCHIPREPEALEAYLARLRAH